MYHWPEHQCKHPPSLGYPRGHGFLGRAAKYLLCLFRQKCCFHTPPGDVLNAIYFPPLKQLDPVWHVVSPNWSVSFQWVAQAVPSSAPACLAGASCPSAPPFSFWDCWQRPSLWFRHSEAITRWHRHLCVCENCRVSLCARHTRNTVLHPLHI